MARTQTMVQLTDDLIVALDEVSAQRGISRSALVRDLVTDGLDAARRDLVGEQIADGYRRIPQGIQDEWGDVSALADVAARDAARRLDGEERAAGFEPW